MSRLYAGFQVTLLRSKALTFLKQDVLILFLSKSQLKGNRLKKTLKKRVFKLKDFNIKKPLVPKIKYI